MRLEDTRQLPVSKRKCGTLAGKIRKPSPTSPACRLPVRERTLTWQARRRLSLEASCSVRDDPAPGGIFRQTDRFARHTH
jgi:hypothetical protein